MMQFKRFPLFEKIVALTSVHHPGTEMAAPLQFLQARYPAEFKKDGMAALTTLRPLLTATSHPWQTRIQALYHALDMPQTQASVPERHAGA